MTTSSFPATTATLVVLVVAPECPAMPVRLAPLVAAAKLDLVVSQAAPDPLAKPVLAAHPERVAPLARVAR